MTPSRILQAALTRRPRTIRKTSRPFLGLERLEGREVPAAPPVQFFFSPLPATDVRTSLGAIHSSFGNTVVSVTSLTATVNGTIIYYDHWEDGYEANLANPTQSTTQIWGDGDPNNGVAPGYPDDIINAGAVITLRNNIAANPRDPAVILFDGGDRIGASQTLAMTRANWGTSLGTVLASAVEVYDTRFHGTSFTAPVGTNVIPHINAFEYTAFHVMATRNGTNVQIDADGDGIFESSKILNMGQTWVSSATVKAGGRVVSDGPIQVQLATGDIGDTYESRWYNLIDDAKLANDYLSPVGTTKAKHPVNIFIHNPNQNSITVTFENSSGSGTIDIDAGTTARHIVTGNTATHLYTVDRSRFTAVGAADIQEPSVGSSTTYDWGFALQPTASLSPIAVVGWGPGTSETTPQNNYSPVWVTVTRDTTVYVDFDGNPATGALIDPNNNRYDVAYNISRLESVRVFDNADKNQTGMRLYTLDGTKISVVWGEDASVAVTGSPAMDLGTTVPAFPVPIFEKGVDFAPGGDRNGDGLFNSGDTLRYSLTITNLGLYPILNSVVGDTLPIEVAYIPGSTRLIDGSGVSLVNDDLVGATLFPMDEGGFTITNIDVGAVTTITFDVLVNPGLAAKTVSVTNVGVLSYGLVFTSDRVTSAIRAAIGDRVWHDLNRDGIQDPGEPGLENVRVDLFRDSNGNGKIDAGEVLVTSAFSDAKGRYQLIDLNEGDYVARVDVATAPAGFQLITAATMAFTIAPGEVVETADFGFWFDFLPSAVDDSATTLEDTPVDVLVLGNDQLGNPPTTITHFDSSSTKGGKVTHNGGGLFTYTPPQEYHGTDSFTYTITDEDGDSSTATVTITITPVNDDPTATANQNAVTEDGPVIATGNVITDNDGWGVDSDPDGDRLVVSAVNGVSGQVGVTVSGSYGEVRINADGSYSYTLNNALPIVQALATGETLTETFEYTLSDGNGGFDTATLTIRINGRNDAPTLASGGLPDRFHADSDGLSVPLGGFFSDVDNGSVLTFSVLGLPPGLVMNPTTGEVSGRLAADASQGGPYVVTVTGRDGEGLAVSGSFTWTVSNPSPTATANQNAVTEDGPVIATGNVITDNDGWGVDSDPDGDRLVVSAVNGVSGQVGVTVSGSYGEVRINADGSYSYTLNNALPIVQALATGETLTETFEYTLSDGNGGFDTATLTIRINGRNDAPTLASGGLPDLTSLDTDGVSVPLAGYFADVDNGATLTFSAVGLPPGLTIDSTTGVISGTLPIGASASGPYRVTITVSDHEGSSISVPFVWIVNPLGRLSGQVFDDRNNDGIFNGTDEGIAGVSVTLTGVNDQGQSISINQVTTLDGTYQFANLRPGTYTISESQPARLLDGRDTLGTQGGMLGNDVISDIVVVSGTDGTGNNFAELAPARIAGRVYNDLNNNTQSDAGEPGIESVLLTLTGTDDLGVAVSLQTTTDANGEFVFENLRPGRYQLIETQPIGYSQAANSSPMGTVAGDVMSFSVEPGLDAANNLFGEHRPATISGVVYQDTHRNGRREAAFDPGLAGVTVLLIGTDIGGNSIARTTTSGFDGSFQFRDLPPGTYRLVQTLLNGMSAGAVAVGNRGGIAGLSDVSQIVLGAFDRAQNYQFAQVVAAPADRTKRNFLAMDGAGLRAPRQTAPRGIAGQTIWGAGQHRGTARWRR